MKPAGIGANTNVELDGDGEQVANGFQRGNSSLPPSQENQDEYDHDNPFQTLWVFRALK